MLTGLKPKRGDSGNTGTLKNLDPVLFHDVVRPRWKLSDLV